MIDRIIGAAPAKRRSDLTTRALAGGAMIAVALLALWAGGLAFWLLASAAALLMLAEWAGLMRASRLRIGLALIALGVALLVASAAVDGVGGRLWACCWHSRWWWRCSAAACGWEPGCYTPACRPSACCSCELSRTASR